MRHHEIEYWVLKIIEQIKAGRSVEDFRVELKADWPTAEKAARRIAGHANAARGNPILWVIGLDEDRGIVGIKKEDLANWLPQVRSYFDGDVFPTLTDFVMIVDGCAIVVLYLETERAPFVVKNPDAGKPGSGPIERETPWREGTRVRSATRQDLIKILSPIQALPNVDVRSGHLTGRGSGNPGSSIQLDLIFSLYIIPASENRLVIPFRYCGVKALIFNDFGYVELGNIQLAPSWVTEGFPPGEWDTGPSLATIHGTTEELVVDGPGKFSLTAKGVTEYRSNGLLRLAKVVISLLPVNFELPAKIETGLNFARLGSDTLCYWGL